MMLETARRHTMTYEVKYIPVEGAEARWEPVEERVMRDRLGAYFRNVQYVVESMDEGHVARTPYSYYRRRPEEEMS